MRASKDFIMREIAGEHILLPVGAAAVKFNGLITMNDIGRFLYDLLAQDRTEQELGEQIVGAYDVPLETALADIHSFLQQLHEIGALVEDRE